MPAKGNTKYHEGAVFESNHCGPFQVVEFLHGKKILVRFLNTGFEYWTSSTRIVNGQVKDRSLPYILFGVGLNDANYPVETSSNGVRWVCPFFRTWKNMLARCYHNPTPAYTDCRVEKGWLTFSVFKSWMEQQDWEGKHLDKDLFVTGNKVYGPDTCLFVTTEVNQFIKDKSAKRGKYPIGVTKRSDNIFIAQGDLNGEPSYLGSFRTPEEAHEAWKQSKAVAATELASRQSCVKTAEALLEKYT